jgi:hypothetical protein
MPTLEDSVGHWIFISPKFPFRKGERQGVIYPVLLRGVETSGIWIEHEALEKHLLSALKEVREFSNVVEKPIFFLPFSELFYVVGFSLPLDEEALGLQSDL